MCNDCFDYLPTNRYYYTLVIYETKISTNKSYKWIICLILVMGWLRREQISNIWATDLCIERISMERISQILTISVCYRRTRFMALSLFEGNPVAGQVYLYVLRHQFLLKIWNKNCEIRIWISFKIADVNVFKMPRTNKLCTSATARGKHFHFVFRFHERWIEVLNHNSIGTGYMNLIKKKYIL